MVFAEKNLCDTDNFVSIYEIIFSILIVSLILGEENPNFMNSESRFEEKNGMSLCPFCWQFSKLIQI